MELSSQAAAAKAVRGELKQAFPKTKFSVTSESFAGGNSVDIYWDDGPTVDAVDKVVKKYQYGHFDGMTDSYEYSNKREDLPQAKFVMTQRRMSQETKLKLMEKLGIKESEWEAWNDNLNGWNSQLVHREFSQEGY